MSATLPRNEYQAQEDAKYSWLYEGKYGNGPVVLFSRWAFPRFRKPTNAISILDWGCGKGSAQERLGSPYYTGVDIASSVIERNKTRMPKANWLHGDLSDPNIKNSLEAEYDLGFCCDVLEHIPEPYLEQAVKQLCELTKTQMIAVSCIPSKHKDKFGQGLHLSVQNAAKWRELISKYTTIQDFKETSTTAYFFCGENYTKPRIEEIPNQIHGIRLRTHNDGSIWISRENRRVENILDSQYMRVGNGLRWFPKIIGYHEFDVLENKFEGKICYIVGKGPSLDHLTADDFPDSDAPIIAINDSIIKVHEVATNPERVLNTQFDCGIHCCPPNENIKLILAKHSQYLYPSYAQRYVIDHHNFGLGDRSLSVLVAMGMAEFLGCTGIEMFCFDAYTEQKVGYADCVKDHPVNAGNHKDPRRFLSHREPIDRMIEKVNVPVDFRLVDRPSSASVDTPDESHCNHPEQYALFHGESSESTQDTKD
jgi:SAM-dependent methyltransferase